MPDITSTVSDASANSYVEVDDADDYFDERLNASKWTDADDDDKARALIMAARRIDAEQFRGETATDGQALKWPRIGAANDDGEEFDSDEIPVIVQHAQMELALHLLNQGTDDMLAPTGLEGFRRVRIGPMEAEVDKSFRAGDLPENVLRLLRPVISSTRYSARTEFA